MATYATALDVSSFTTDAKYRSWVTTVHNAMSVAGFVQTGDTGQINPATVAKPTATNTLAGYEVWRFADALQSTAPIFMKLSFYSSNVASGNGPSLYLTVGTGSDGAGNITGVNTGLLASGSGSTAPSNTASPILACHTAGYGMILAGGLVQSSFPTNAGFFVVARTCGTDGTLTGQGAVIYRQSGSGNVLATVHGLSFATGAVLSERSPVAGVVTGNAAMTTGNAVPMAKNYANLGYPVPSYGVLSYRSADVAAGSTFSTAVWGGTAHTYYALGSGYVNGMDAFATTTITGAFLWE